MYFAFMALGPFIPVLVFFLLDKKFNLKRKLIKKFRTNLRYFDTISLILFFPFIGYSFFKLLTTGGPLNPLTFSMLFLYYYLKRIPEDMR